MSESAVNCWSCHTQPRTVQPWNLCGAEDSRMVWTL